MAARETRTQVQLRVVGVAVATKPLRAVEFDATTFQPNFSSADLSKKIFIWKNKPVNICAEGRC